MLALATGFLPEEGHGVHGWAPEICTPAFLHMVILALFCQERTCASSCFQRNMHSSVFLVAITNNSKNLCGLKIYFSFMTSSVQLGRLGESILLHMDN